MPENSVKEGSFSTPARAINGTSLFFDTSIYISQEHPSGIEFKKMQGIEYDLIAPLDGLIPLKSDSIASVICTSVVEHVRYPEMFFAESYRVLHSGGRFYIHVPFTYH